MPARRKTTSSSKYVDRPAAVPLRGKRLSPELRSAQILDAAARLVVEQGYLPLPLEQLARNAGASKALIYAYFPSQYALFNALLEREVRSLSLAGLDTASRVQDLQQAAVLCAMLYFDHVSRSGPLLHILMTDPYMSGQVDASLLATRDAFMQRLIDLGSDAMPLQDQEIYVAIEMMAAIPEEAGRLVFNHEIDDATARQICNSLIVSSLKALRAPDSVDIPD